MKKPRREELLGSAVEAIGEVLQKLALCRLFPSFRQPDAVAVTRSLARAASASLDRWQLVSLMADALREWGASQRVALAPALLLVAQSAAVRAVSEDSWGDDDDEGGAAQAQQRPAASTSSGAAARDDEGNPLVSA